jgi:enoyl-CoA hydratase
MTDINIRKNGNIGHITLTREKILNALSHDMALQIEKALHDWSNDDGVKLVLIDAAGEKAFCAGGDVQDLYAKGKAGDYENGTNFWRDEYRLNALIADYNRPYISVMNGIVMGGGVGISALGSHRIVTENTSFALPECAIGLIPDVGSSHLLAQAPGFIGEYLALSGGRVGYEDAIYCGFADHFVPKENLDALIEKLTQSGDAADISKHSQATELGELSKLRNEIDTIFSLDTIGDIISALESSDAAWASKALYKIKSASPISICVTLETIRIIRANPGINNALRQEFRFVSRALEHGDFVEGVRALIIDKDKQPDWRFATIADVPDDVVQLFLSPVVGGDIEFS